VNDRYFLLLVGIGFDGEVTQSVEKKHLKRLGVLGYLLASKSRVRNAKDATPSGA
jgi:diacylglycerol kinase family enzyme